MSEETTMIEADEGEKVLTPEERRYATLVEKISDICKGAETENLHRYHKIGSLVRKFIESSKKKADGNAEYGESVIIKLGQDLQDRGVLADVKDTKRFLYWALNLSDRYPEWEMLEKLAERGFSVTHAKLLISASPEIAEEVSEEMIKDGKVISTRDLDALIQEKGSTAVAERAAKASRGDEDDDDDDSDAGTVSVDPVKSISLVEKALTRVNSEIPNTFIAIRETREKGLDDKHYNKYVKQLKAAQPIVDYTLEALVEFKKEIDSELEEIKKAE
jgi:hypothetical protein